MYMGAVKKSFNRCIIAFSKGTVKNVCHLNYVLVKHQCNQCKKLVWNPGLIYMVMINNN